MGREPRQEQGDQDHAEPDRKTNTNGMRQFRCQYAGGPHFQPRWHAALPLDLRFLGSEVPSLEGRGGLHVLKGCVRRRDHSAASCPPNAIGYLPPAVDHPPAVRYHPPADWILTR